MPEGHVRSFHTFDTHNTDATLALVRCIDDIPEGELVLVAAKDDAKARLTEGCRQALARLGARLADRISYRGGYCLIGIKGQPAMAEATNPHSKVTEYGRGAVVTKVTATFGIPIITPV